MTYEEQEIFDAVKQDRRERGASGDAQFERAMRRFKKRSAEVIREMKDREYFKKPSLEQHQHVMRRNRQHAKDLRDARS